MTPVSDQIRITNLEGELQNLKSNREYARYRAEAAQKGAVRLREEVAEWEKRVKELEDKIDAYTPLTVGDIVEYKLRISNVAYEVLATYINQDDPHDRLLKIAERRHGRRVGGSHHTPESRLRRVRS